MSSGVNLKRRNCYSSISDSVGLEVEHKRFSEKNQTNIDLELFPTRKQILNLKPYQDNNGEEI